MAEITNKCSSWVVYTVVLYWTRIPCW